MIIFAYKQAHNQADTNSKTEAHSNPLWIVGERANFSIFSDNIVERLVLHARCGSLIKTDTIRTPPEFINSLESRKISRNYVHFAKQTISREVSNIYHAHILYA